MPRRASTLTVFALFFVSGACGLIYQVVWGRMMTHILGATVFAVSTVLAAFMAGLAIGSYYLGKRGDRAANPLRWFACLELGIGLTALFVLLGLDHLTPAYVWITRSMGDSFALLIVARFVVAFALLIIPTTLMGATLPLLSRFAVTRFDRAGHTLGALYGTNTFGAVVGSLLAGFYLIGNLGIHQTVYLAVLLNLGVGSIAWLMSRKIVAAGPGKADKAAPSSPAEIEPPSPYQRRLHRLLLWGFAFSGLTSFAYEVLWTRSLIFFVGNSTYAFVTMLSAFLTGIAVGSYAIRFLIDRLKHPMRAFAWIQIGIGISAALAMPLLIWLMRTDAVLALLVDEGKQLRTGFATRFGLCFTAMLIPTLLIGTTFPLVGRIVLKDLRRTSSDIGKVYAVNTLGNIVGALLPGFVMLHFVGIQKGIWLMALTNVGIGAVLLAHGKTRLHPWRLAFPACVIVLFIAVGSASVKFQFPSQGQTTDDQVLYYREGPMATTMVYDQGTSGRRHMAVDGIKIGGTSRDVDHKQQWLAHLPKLLMTEYRTELSVGLGSGILAGESARHEQLEKITCVEIAPTVVEGAALFGTENHGILSSRRAQIVVDDAVNHLMATRERYDIISSDGKTEPEFSVNGTFFSTEYYTLMRDRLAPGGLAIQWIPLHYPPRIFRCVLKTFSDVFPHVMVWHANGNCFLVGSNHEVTLDTVRISSRLTDSQLPFDTLRRYGITTAPSLLAHLVAREDLLRTELRGVEANTLRRPIIEFYDFEDFAAAKDQRQLENLRFILSIRGKGAVGSWVMRSDGDIAAAYKAEGAYLLGEQALLEGKAQAAFGPHFGRALSLAPDNQAIRYHIFLHYLETALHFAREQNMASAETYILRAIKLWPKDAESRMLYGRILLQTNQAAAAIAQFQIAVELDPQRIAARHLLASLYLRVGNADATMAQLRAVLDIDPNDLIALYSLGYLLGERRAFDQALPLLAKAYRLAPENPRAIHCYAWITYLSGDKKKAREIVRNGGSYYTASKEMERFRNIILR